MRVRQRKDGSTYTSVLYVLAGKQTSSSFNDHQEAVDFQQLVNRVGPVKAVEVWRIQRPTTEGYTVASWCHHHVDHLTGANDTTKAKYRAYIANDIESSNIGALPLNALTHDDVARWLNNLGGSAKTKANKHGFLSGALAAAVRKHELAANVCDGNRLPRDLARALVRAGAQFENGELIERPDNRTEEEAA